MLFNPVYQDNNSEQGEFWGFVILVIDWDRFIREINLDYLSDADFCYRIWTYDRSSSDKNFPENIVPQKTKCREPGWDFLLSNL